MTREHAEENDSTLAPNAARARGFILIGVASNEGIGDGGHGAAEDVDECHGDVFVDNCDGNNPRPLQSVHSRQVLLRVAKILGDREEAARYGRVFPSL